MLLVFAVSLLAFGPWMVRLAGVVASASAFWRLSLAVLPLLLLVRYSGERVRSLPPTVLLAMVGAGCLYGLGTLLMGASALRTTLANCALIGNFSSFFVAGIALAAERRVPDRTTSVALGLSAGGLLLLLGPSVALSNATIAGDLVALAAAVLFTGYFLLIMRMPRSLKPLTTHGIGTMVGALVVAPFALGGDLVPQYWWPILVLVAAQIVGQGLVVYTIPRLPPVIGGLSILLFPLMNIVIGWAWYAEEMGFAQIAGALLIVAALSLLQYKRRSMVAARQT